LRSPSAITERKKENSEREKGGKKKEKKEDRFWVIPRRDTSGYPFTSTVPSASRLDGWRKKEVLKRGEGRRREKRFESPH